MGGGEGAAVGLNGKKVGIGQKTDVEIHASLQALLAVSTGVHSTHKCESWRKEERGLGGGQ